MGKTSQKEKRLAGRVSLALAAGMFSVVPTVHGMPTADAVTNATDARSTGLGIATSGSTMNVTGTQQNTVAHWKDFSIKSTETVHFEENKNFMNVVTGKATSAIDGAMTGGNNVYLINPNGVIFGSTAKVNVGNLYVSTRNDTENLKQRFTGLTAAGESTGSAAVSGSAVLSTLANNALTSEVVSLIDEKGYVAATEVVVEGKNIRFLNANALTTSEPTADANGKFTTSINEIGHPAAANVTFRANAIGTTKNTDNYGDGYIHVGNGTASNYTAQNLNNHEPRSGEANGVVNYSLIRTAADLQNINNNLSGKYMLANDIDASTMTAPIGSATMYNGSLAPAPFVHTPFAGWFDGMYYTVKNLNSSQMGLNADYSAAGLFGYTNGATIENVGVENATFATKNAGGIVGYANNTKLRNVWNAGGTGQIGTGTKSLGKH